MTERRTQIVLAVCAGVSLVAFGLLRWREARAARGAARIEWLDFDAGVERAQASGKRVIVEFTAPWCRACRDLERKTLSDPRVARAIRDHFVPIRVDTDREPRRGDDFFLRGIPTVVALTADGETVSYQWGYAPPGRFLAWLEDARTEEPRDARWGEKANRRRSKDGGTKAPAAR